MASSNSIHSIRSHFPALERVHRGKPVAYFDGPGGTQVPRQVVEAMSDYLFHHNANTHWPYPTSAETDAAISSARAAMADFLNASPDEIAFGANMTSITFHLSRALGNGWGAGDEVVVTELDHHANVDPWKHLETERGVTARVVRMIPETGQLDWQDFEKKVSRRTKLIALGGASNALGTINDLARAAGLARSVGALLFVDAVHYASHELVDVRALDCDFLACSPYKFHGPHIGVLYARKSIFEKVTFPKLAPAPGSAPEKAETGTMNHEGMVGAAAAVDFLASLGEGATRRAKLEDAFGMLHERGMALLGRLWEGLGAVDGVQLYGPPPGQPRTPTVSFTVGDRASDDVARRLAERGVFASSGNFYAKTVVERLGRKEQGLVRAGCACYATEEEVDRLVEGVREIAAGG